MGTIFVCARIYICLCVTLCVFFIFMWVAMCVRCTKSMCMPHSFQGQMMKYFAQEIEDSLTQNPVLLTYAAAHEILSLHSSIHKVMCVPHVWRCAWLGWEKPKGWRVTYKWRIKRHRKEDAQLFFSSQINQTGRWKETKEGKMPILLAINKIWMTEWNRMMTIKRRLSVSGGYITYKQIKADTKV